MIGNYLAAARKAFVFQGRSGRAEFWGFTSINLAVISCLAVIDQNLSSPAGEPAVGMASGLCFLLLCVPQTAVTIRRLHDSNRSAWWAVIGAVPLVGTCAVLVMAVIKGDRGENRYGAAPRD